LKTILRMIGITKRFPGVLALDGVDFDLREGEVHTLLGENGAGKTTLMNILFGLYKADEGTIEYLGNRVHISSPHDALRLGIGMIQQHFTLVPSFTVAENVALGLGLSENLREISKRIREISQTYGLEVDPGAKIWQLSVGERQRVEIIKLLYLGAKIVILDEPTAVLTPQEASSLFKAIEKMKENGTGIIFISHKLNEVMEVSDRVTVLKKGKVVGTLFKGELEERKLARMMVGREVVMKIEREKAKPGEIVLQIKDLHALSDKGHRALNGISLEVRAGEILGIAGVAGNGQRELAEAIAGLRDVEKGRIIFLGEDITRKSVLYRIVRGISYIPQDRKGVALSPNLTVAENLFLKSSEKKTWFSLEELFRRAKGLIEKYDIRTPGPETPVKYLSGGNMQKVVIAREFELKPKLIIAVHPTRGLDVASMEYVYRSLIKARDEGAAVLLLAGELYEIFSLSDRVGVIYEGRIVGYASPSPTPDNIEKIGLMMAGVKV